MKSALTFFRADHGQAIRQAIGTLAALVALTYTLGYLTGQFAHSINDQLAGVRQIPVITAPATLARPAVSMVTLLTLTAPPLESKAMGRAASGSGPIASNGAQSAELIPPFSSLTVAELRIMARQAGHRKLARSGRRSQLLEVLA